MSLPSASIDAFYATAQLRSFTQAAERLHITQSALSQRIKNLESELGTTLFIRERSGILLTEAGDKLLRYCRAREHLEAEIINSIQGGPTSELRGILRVGGFSSVIRSVVLPVLSRLVQKHPDIQLQVMTREMYELPPLLKSGDLVLRPVETLS